MKNFVYEDEILKFWKENSTYEKVKQNNSGKKEFNHIDGPPFPTGEPHVGHLRNWSIKDAYLRFKRLCGYDVYARDGYDVHGLPVEIKVQQKLGLKDVAALKKYGEDKFVEECKKYVDSMIGTMQERRERFGLWMDRDYYKTSHTEYISLAWRFFKEAHKKNLIYKDNKVVAWSPGAETTLSDYEIKDSYAVLEDPSIFVKFELEEKERTTKYKESFVIWTTTPWTLQANLAIAMNPEFEYVKALVELEGKEEVLIVAKELLVFVIEMVSKSRKITLKSILETKGGAEFEGVRYKHVLLDETPSQKEFRKSLNRHIHAIVLADYVTLGGAETHLDKLAKKVSKHSIGEAQEEESQEEVTLQGTGLVHIAPGHGFDDFEVGRKYHLPVFSPVDSKAHLTEGKFKGEYFKDSDSKFVEYLVKKKVMLHHELKKHKYPLCWRTKVPIVYRAVDQWWIKRTEVKEDIIKENQSVKWHPNFAKESFNHLMEKVEDWPISRQRFWGIPLPIFEDEDGEFEVFGSKEELEERVGKKLDDIHKSDLKNLEITNLKTGTVMKAVPYTADVWFDSGCASFASHYGEGLSYEEILKKYYPMHWITESEDQIRGWFSSLFNVGTVVTDSRPYNQVLCYGFVMAKDGTKMSKSLGNGIDGNEAIERFGSDATRYYLLTKAAPEAKINFDEEEFVSVFSFFNTLENSIKFVSSYLDEFTLKDERISAPESLDVEDKWLLYRLNETLLLYSRHMEENSFNQAFKLVEDFVVKDFSKTYLKLIKERTEQRDDHLLALLSQTIRKVLLMLSSAIPFLTEKIYLQTSLSNKKESLFLEIFHDADEYVLRAIEKEGIAQNFELAQDIVQAILNAREKAKIGVRWPLAQVDIISSKDIEHDLKPFEKLIKTMTNISKLQYDLEGVDVSYIVKPNFATLKEDFPNPSDAIKAINMGKHYIREDLKAGLKGGKYEGVELDFNKHIIKEIELNAELVSSEFESGSLVLHTHQDEILLEEGYLREVLRRVQMLRKEAGLSKEDCIELSFEGSEDYFEELVGNWANSICKRVGANEIVTGELENKKEFKVKDKLLVVSLRKTS